MTHLRKIMLEELQRRNYAQTTIDCYTRTLEHFSRYFQHSPDQLGPEHIREYQAALFKKWKLAPNTVNQRLAALRFFYNSYTPVSGLRMWHNCYLLTSVDLCSSVVRFFSRNAGAQAL